MELSTRLLAEVFATALLIILGNGAVANVELDGTKAGAGNWNPTNALVYLFGTNLFGLVMDSPQVA